MVALYELAEWLGLSLTLLWQREAVNSVVACCPHGTHMLPALLVGLRATFQGFPVPDDTGRTQCAAGDSAPGRVPSTKPITFPVLEMSGQEEQKPAL